MDSALVYVIFIITKELEPTLHDLYMISSLVKTFSFTLIPLPQIISSEEGLGRCKISTPFEHFKVKLQTPALSSLDMQEHKCYVGRTWKKDTFLFNNPTLKWAPLEAFQTWRRWITQGECCKLSVGSSRNQVCSF